MTAATLIVVGGLPGAGKSTVARLLACRLGAAWLRVDTVEGALLGAGLAPGAGGYAAAQALAADNLALGLDVVADSVNPLATSRAGWRDAAVRASAAVLEVELVCSDPAEHRRRIESRPDAGTGQPRVGWDDVLRRAYEPWTGRRLVVDTARTRPEEAAALIAARLADPRGADSRWSIP